MAGWINPVDRNDFYMNDRSFDQQSAAMLIGWIEITIIFILGIPKQYL